MSKPQGAAMPESDVPGKGDDGLRKGDLASPRRWSNSEMWAWALVAVGVLLRVFEYSDNRQLYADEEDLKRNLVGLAFYDFQTPLVKNQLASPGFLAVERLMILLPLPFPPAARLIPFVCSIASMFLMRSVARRYLTAARRPDRRWPLRGDRLATLLFRRDQAVQQRRGADAHCAPAGGSSTVLTSRRIVPEVAERLPRSHRVRSDWRLVLSSSGAGSGGCWKLSHFEGRLSERLGQHDRRGWDEHPMGLEFRGLLLGLRPDCFSKDGFLERWWAFAFLPFPPRSLADLEANLLAVDQRVQLSVRHSHSPGRASVSVHRLRVVSARRLVAGPSMERRPLSADLADRHGSRGFDAASVSVPRPALDLLDSFRLFTRRPGRGRAGTARVVRS